MIAMTDDMLQHLYKLVLEAYRREVTDHPEKRDIRVGASSTQADVDFERAIADAGRTVLGNSLVVIGEEAVSAGQWADITSDLVLLVDPIDGTRLFREAAPGFATTFTVLERGRVVGGCILLPQSGDTLLCGADGRILLRSDAAAERRPTTVAVRRSDGPEAESLARRFEDEGFITERLGSSARRLFDIASGRCAGLVKKVAVEHGVPRLWGIATGLSACAAQGAHFWWDPKSRLLAVGGDGLRAVWPKSSPLRPITYEHLWSSLLGSGSRRRLKGCALLKEPCLESR